MDSDKAIQGANISQLSVNLQILHRIMCTKGIHSRVLSDTVVQYLAQCPYRPSINT